MSGLYFAETGPDSDPHELARLLSAQLVYGGEPVNHYAAEGRTVLGLVSPDRLGQGVMPRFLTEQGLWGIIQGELYSSSTYKHARNAHAEAENDLALFAALYRAGTLDDLLPGLNGAFFVVLWDPVSGDLVAVNDRFGLYPVYWAQGNGRFCLADRVLCAVLAGAAPGRWDLQGLAMLLTTDDFALDTTLAEGVSAFPQASRLIKRGRRLEWHRYWAYDYAPRHANRPLDAVAAEVGALFTRAVQRQVKDGRRIGVTLSGGLDSRCIVAAGHALGIELDTFTWGKPGCYDRQFARDVSHTFNTTHYDCEYALQHFDTRFDAGMQMAEGLINVFDCHMLAHLEVLEPHSELVLNGYAGDLILGGSYLRPTWMRQAPVDEVARALFNWRITNLSENRLSEAMPEISSLPPERMPSAVYREGLAALGALPSPDLVDRFVLENRVRRVTSMGTVLIRAVCESAACFFDYDLIDFETGVPAPVRAEHRLYLRMMALTFPESLQVRWQRTLLRPSAPVWMSIGSKAMLKACRILEKRIGWPTLASRQSPVDFANWLRGPLKPWMDRVCLESNPAADEVLSPEFCARTWQAHLAGADHTRLLGALAAVRGFGAQLSRARQGLSACDSRPAEVRRT